MVTIHITDYDLQRITEWNKNNPEKRLTTSGKFPYNEFTLLLKDVDGTEYGYEVKLFDNEITKGAVQFFFKEEKVIRVFDGFQKFNDDFYKIKNAFSNDIQTHYALVFGTFFFIMAYIQRKMERRKTRIIEGKDRQVKSAKNNGKKAAKTRDTFLLQDFIVYEHKGNTGIKHTYTCEAWGVRGHYRHYKSGKVVFVKEYTKGKNKDAKVDKNVYLRKGK